MATGFGSTTSSFEIFHGDTSLPAPGIGATLILWTDTHAYTITRISPSGKSFWMKRDLAKRTDKNGWDGFQEWSYSPDPNACEVSVRRTKHGWMSNGCHVRVGYRHEHFDPYF